MPGVGSARAREETAVAHSSTSAEARSASIDVVFAVREAELQR
jgi:hypothetical protein